MKKIIITMLFVISLNSGKLMAFEKISETVLEECIIFSEFQNIFGRTGNNNYLPWSYNYVYRLKQRVLVYPPYYGGQPKEVSRILNQNVFYEFPAHETREKAAEYFKLQVDALIAQNSILRCL